MPELISGSAVAPARIGGAEDDAVDARPVGERVAGHLERDAGPRVTAHAAAKIPAT